MFYKKTNERLSNKLNTRQKTVCQLPEFVEKNYETACYEAQLCIWT